MIRSAISDALEYALDHISMHMLCISEITLDSRAWRIDDRINGADHRQCLTATCRTHNVWWLAQEMWWDGIIYQWTLIIELFTKQTKRVERLYKIDINYYGKMVPWLSLKLSQSRSGAEFSIGQKPTQLAKNIVFWAGTIFPPCGPVAPKQWCAVVAVTSLNARERLKSVSDLSDS